MSIGGIGAPAPAKAAELKTEWSRDVTAPKEAPKGDSMTQTSVGEELNKLSGVQTNQVPTPKKKQLDKEAFLKMFMTQLKYQDPTSPVDNEKMAQQMSMFSQIEQAVTTNQYLEKMLAKQNDQQGQAWNLIGKHVQASQSTLFHNKAEMSALKFKLPKEASEVKVDILDAAGNVVNTLDLARRAEGEVLARWDGNKSDGSVAESGRYFFKVRAKDLASQDIAIEDKVEGKVTGVTQGNGQTLLMIGDHKISLNEVTTVQEASALQPAANDARKETENALSTKPSDVNNAVGMKTEGDNIETEKKPAMDINIDDALADSLKADLSDEDDDPRMNPLMPFFMR